MVYSWVRSASRQESTLCENVNTFFTQSQSSLEYCILQHKSIPWVMKRLLCLWYSLYDFLFCPYLASAPLLSSNKIKALSTVVMLCLLAFKEPTQFGSVTGQKQDELSVSTIKKKRQQILPLISLPNVDSDFKHAASELASWRIISDWICDIWSHLKMAVNLITFKQKFCSAAGMLLYW